MNRLLCGSAVYTGPLSCYRYIRFESANFKENIDGLVISKSMKKRKITDMTLKTKRDAVQRVNYSNELCTHIQYTNDELMVRYADIDAQIYQFILSL